MRYHSNTVRPGTLIAQRILLLCFAVIIINLTLINGIGAIGADRDVIIVFKRTVGPSEQALIHSHSGLVKNTYHLIPAISARIPEIEIDKIKNDARIAYVENDKVFKAADEYTNSQGVQHIGSGIIHEQGINGTGVKMAILDTGIDYNHEDLKDNYKGGTGFVQDANGNVYTGNYDDSYNSHSTRVAGIIAAKKNDIGVVGVAPNADLYAVKVLAGDNTGYASWIISGIQWAVDNHMNIATMSIALRECTSNCPPGYNEGLQSMHDAVDAAYNSGVLLVAAAGNTYGGNVTYPAAYDSVIAVTAVDSRDIIANFSPIDPEVELVAPGVNINSTIRDGYGILSGTSMAAPHVAGVAALIFSTDFQDVNRDGKKNNRDVREILRNSARDAGESGKDNIYGYGLVDAVKAIRGYSAYEPVDLSVSVDDGVETVVSGDGILYRYIITVRNNGTVNNTSIDAVNIKLSDTWPVGFARGSVTATQGYCDIAASSTNFTCDLGRIKKDGEVKITVDYSVSSTTFEGSYTNQVGVTSSTPDFNPNNNIAADTNRIGTIKLGPVRTAGKEINDSKVAYLSLGNYNINIYNINVSRIDMKVYENGVIRNDLSSSFRLNKSNDIDFNIYANDILKTVFTPYGSKGSSLAHKVIFWIV